MTLSPSFSPRRVSRRFARIGAVAACCVSLFFGAFASAAEPAQDASPLAAIKPFVNADTLAVARFNVQTLDVDQLQKTLGDVVTTALQNVGYNAEALETLRPKLDATLSVAAKDGKAALEAFRVASGLTEVYFVAQTAAATPTGFADEAGVAFLVPVDSLAPMQLELIKEFAEEIAYELDLESAVYKKRWLVFAFDLTAFGRYYKNFKASENKEIEAFFNANADAALAAYCGKVEIRRFLDEAFDGELTRELAGAPRSIRSALNAFDSSFAGLRLTVSPETLVARADFRFDSEASAERMSNALYALVDTGLDEFNDAAFRYGEPFEAIDAEVADALNLPSLAREILRAEIRAQLPRLDGDALVWEVDVPRQLDQNLRSSTLGVAAGLLLGLAYGDL
ncbi:MAG: hypothetical protein IJE97_10915 [Thermoguttaceae bacterium]|nr:hypothetical protein [Thermoguttaceae bacterium]